MKTWFKYTAYLFTAMMILGICINKAGLSLLGMICLVVLVGIVVLEGIDISK